MPRKAKKDGLGEVRAINTAKSARNKEGIFIHSDEWEAWELLDEDEDPKDPDNWGFLADGSLSECIEAISFTIAMELDMKLMKEGRDFEPENYFEELRELTRHRQEEIRIVCLKDGECDGGIWTIRSVRTREQCEWVAKHGDPGF